MLCTCLPWAVSAARRAAGSGSRGLCGQHMHVFTPCQQSLGTRCTHSGDGAPGDISTSCQTLIQCCVIRPLVVATHTTGASFLVSPSYAHHRADCSTSSICSFGCFSYSCQLATVWIFIAIVIEKQGVHPSCTIVYPVKLLLPCTILVADLAFLDRGKADAKFTHICLHLTHAAPVTSHRSAHAFLGNSASRKSAPNRLLQLSF